MKRLFVDMDGTLAVFSYVKNIEDLYKKGYFAKLRPICEVVDAIKYIISDVPQVEVYILSSYLQDSRFALAEKQRWLDSCLPGVKMSNRIFLPYPEDKADTLGKLSKEDYLLDDYTPNLVSWDEKGGTAIKLLNGINDTTGRWQGIKVRYDAVNLRSEIINKIVTSKIVKYETDEEIPGQLKLDKSIFKGGLVL